MAIQRNICTDLSVGSSFYGSDICRVIPVPGVRGGMLFHSKNFYQSGQHPGQEGGHGVGRGGEVVLGWITRKPWEKEEGEWIGVLFVLEDAGLDMLWPVLDVGQRWQECGPTEALAQGGCVPAEPVFSMASCV